MSTFLLYSVRRMATRVAVLTCVGLGAVTGVAAAASCPAQASGTPFAAWGDDSGYFLAPGGSFEGSAAALGWSLDHAAVTSGNEPFGIGASAGDAHSLTIGAGGSASSPALCLDRSMPYFQFFARQVVPGSDLKVEIQAAHSHWPALTLADLPDGSMPGWAPVGRIILPGGMIPRGLSFHAALRFVVPGASGSWQIDDVYVDPYRVN
jgi:hypothetical protein